MIHQDTANVRLIELHDYASRTLELVEDRAGELGARSVELHVFGHNHRAQALYENVGYNVKSITMAKAIRTKQGRNGIRRIITGVYELLGERNSYSLAPTMTVIPVNAVIHSGEHSTPPVAIYRITYH